MSEYDIKAIHKEALSDIKIITEKFYKDFQENKIEILKNFSHSEIPIDPVSIIYPPDPGSNQLTKNKIDYFSDHLPITEEHADTIIISWNIGIGVNNSAWTYQMLCDIIERTRTKFKTNYEFKEFVIRTMVEIIFTYISKMEILGKPIILHLQECSYDVYNKLQTRFLEKNFACKFMPQVIAKVKEEGGRYKVKLYYIEEQLKKYNNFQYTLGLSSFIFTTPESIINLKMYPTSANLFLEKKDLHLESRISLVFIILNDKIHIHYNLHLKLEGDPRSVSALTKSKELLDLYSKKNFVNITNQTKGRKIELDLQELLIREIRKDESVDNIIKIEDNQLQFKDSEMFVTTEPRYMCGDFNAILALLREIPINTDFDRSGSKVDYIVKIIESIEGVRPEDTFRELTSLRDRVKPKEITRGSDKASWRHKYLKYKAKYLYLKSSLN